MFGIPKSYLVAALIAVIMMYAVFHTAVGRKYVLGQ